MVWGLLVVIACLGGALFASLCRSQRLLSQIRHADRNLANSVALVDMAEQIANLGRWRADPHDQLERSDGMCRITGFPRRDGARLRYAM